MAATAQGVAVAPHAVHIDHRTRAGAIELYNPDNDPVEVEISTLFGFPTTDSTGTMKVRYFEDDSAYPSAAGWIRAFPRRVTVPARTRQTVRLLAQPPAGLPDGEYWTRIAVSSASGQVPVGGVADTAVKVALTLRVRTIIAVNYRHGLVKTGARMDSLRASVTGDSLAVRVQLTREGNAAFLGTLHTILLDAAGVEVARDDVQVAVYYELAPRRLLSLEHVPRGRYTLVSRLTTQRTDFDTGTVLPAEPVADTISVAVP
jgi:hypothetical protein